MQRPAPGFPSRPPAPADVRLEPPEMLLPLSGRSLRSHGNSLIREFKKFKSSSPPARILFFRDGEWTDFPPAAFDAIRGEFVAGRTAFELRIAERVYVFDFLAMTMVEMETGASNSIAWIDASDRCFFPVSAVDERGSPPMPAESASAAASFVCDSAECHREDGCEATSAVASLEKPRWSGTKVLGDDDRFCKVVTKLFLSGLQRFAPNVTVTAVHSCSLSGPGRSSRARSFQLQAQMTKAARGDAELKFGWYAATATEVAAIVSHGFGQADNEHLGANACGVGVHLAAPQCPYLSALLPEAGAAAGDERHMVLCRVIMGRQEKVEAGSEQYHPSSEEFDSGVDDLTNPKWYVVWSTHMNTHILPEYIVSFKLPRQQQPSALQPMTASCRRAPPVSRNLPFTRLLAEMGGCLPSSISGALQNIYKQYKSNKIGKQDFIRHVRTAVGDKVLLSTIRKIRGF